MSKTISNLSVGLFGDVSHFTHAFGVKAKGSVHSFAESLKEMGAKALELTGVGAMIGTAFEAVMEIGKGFKLAGEFDKATVSLGAFMSGAEQARGVLNELKELAVRSPFDLSDFSGAARQLAAFGTSADQIVPTVKMLGDIAAGSGTGVNELAQLYIRVKDEGRLAGREIREFTNAGIPLTQALAQSMHLPVNQVRALAEQGRVTFPMVQQAFIAMTQNGGAFNDMMRKQSGTFAGMFTTVSHVIDDNLQKIADGFAQAFNGKDSISDLTQTINLLGTALGKIANFVGWVVNSVVQAVSQAKAAVESFIQSSAALKSVIEWMQAQGLLPGHEGGGQKAVPAPKIEPIPPQPMTITPHVDKSPLIKWGSAEMLRLQQEWSGRFPKILKHVAAATAHPAAGAVGSVVNDMFKSAAKGNSSRTKDRPDIAAAKNSSSFDILDTDTYVDSHGHRQKYSAAHPNPFTDIITKDNISDYALKFATRPHAMSGIKTADGQYHYQGVYQQHKDIAAHKGAFSDGQAETITKAIQLWYNTQLTQNQQTQVANF